MNAIETAGARPGPLRRILFFYIDGFRRMTLGRTLWAIIIIKLIVMFAILKVFFFPNYLNTNFASDQERADHVSTELIRAAQK